MAPEILPICTTREVRGRVYGDGRSWVPVHCMFCGKPHGYCPETTTEPGGGYVGYVCDPCAEIPRNSELVGLSIVPDAVHWQRVRDAQIERRGRELTLRELAEVVADGTSALAKLLRSG